MSKNVIYWQFLLRCYLWKVKKKKKSISDIGIKITTKSVFKIFPIDWKLFNDYKHWKAHIQSQAFTFE